jgi:VWFA-related protein
MNDKLIRALLLVCIFAPLCFAQTLKVDVNLINVFATVKDDRGNFVSNLTKDDFRVYEDDQPQDIQIFERQENVDSYVGFLLDSSGSMVDILPYMKRGVLDFTRAVHKKDDYFLSSFGSTTKLLYHSSQPTKQLDDALTSLRAWGSSVLFDALLDGIGRVERSNRPRKALIVFTDGNDNGSNVSYGRITEEIQKTGALLYFVAIGSPILVDSHTLEPLSELSGGRTLYVPKQNSLSPVLDEIRYELGQQYYLGYYAARKPGLHKLRVEVPGKNVRVRAKTGYRG